MIKLELKSNRKTKYIFCLMKCFKAVGKLGAHLTTPVEIENEKNLFKKELCKEEVEQCHADIDKYWPGKKSFLILYKNLKRFF